MDYNELLDHVCDYINEKLDGAKAVVMSTVKNNGVKLSGLSISKEGVNAAPTIYMENFYLDYLNGTDIWEIAEKVIEIYNNTAVSKDIDVDFFMNYEKAKSHMFIKLINAEKNEELLKSVPHETCMDLAVVAYCKIKSKEIGNGSILINNKHLEMWNIKSGELFADARENTGQTSSMKIRDIMDVLRESGPLFVDDILPPVETEDRTGMYVVTSEDGFYGAAYMAMPDKLREMSDKLEGDFYIIPSSVHELLILPKECGDLDVLKEMIVDVNESVVEREEVLADHAYYYSADDATLIF